MNKDVTNNQPQSEGDNSSELSALTEELAQCAMRSKEYLEGWQRAKADFINYKNDEGKRLEDMARFITVGLIQDTLPVLDSFDLAFQYSMPKEMERGVLLIRLQFEDVLKKRGLEEILVAGGESFNPEKHESIGEVVSDAPAGVIAEVLQKGYTLRGKVLRAAKVRLSKGSPAE